MGLLMKYFELVSLQCFYCYCTHLWSLIPAVWWIFMLRTVLSVAPSGALWLKLLWQLEISDRSSCWVHINIESNSGPGDVCCMKQGLCNWRMIALPHCLLWHKQVPLNFKYLHLKCLHASFHVRFLSEREWETPEFHACKVPVMHA